MEISRIEKAYRFLGLNQKQFAEALGFSAKMIKNYSLGTLVSVKFISAMENAFPQINVNYLRNTEDNMLREPISPVEVSPVASGSYSSQDCSAKDEKIRDLEKRIADKEEIIEVLRDQVQLYKEKLSD